MTEVHKGKRIFYNIVSGVAGQVVMVLLGFLIPRLVLVNFGSEVNGVVNTVTQIFTYLCLLEAGVGLATLQALYNPVALGDHKGISGILSATNWYYKRTGMIYGAVVIFLAAVYPLAVSSGLSWSEMFGIVLFCGIPNVISYLVVGKYRLLLQAEGKNYILNNMEAGMYFLVSIGKIVLLLTTRNILLVQAVQCVSALIQVLYFEWYFRKYYPWLDLKAQPDHAAISQKSYVLVHQISGVVFNNTAPILLSFFCDFRVVSVYTTYHLFFTYMERLITTVTSGITFSLGQLFHTDRKRFLEFHDAYETCYMMFVFILYSVMGVFMLPFLKLYTAGVTDINYLDPRLLLLFLCVNLLANGKLPCNQVINFAAHFEQTKNRAVIEALINLCVSVIAIRAVGIYGGLLGAMAALLYRGNDMIFYANHRILKRSVLPTYRKWFLNALVFCVIMWFSAAHGQEYTGYLSMVGRACMTGIGILFLYGAVNLIAERKALLLMWNYLKGRRQKG